MVETEPPGRRVSASSTDDDDGNDEEGEQQEENKDDHISTAQKILKITRATADSRASTKRKGQYPSSDYVPINDNDRFDSCDAFKINKNYYRELPTYFGSNDGNCQQNSTTTSTSHGQI